MARFYGLHEWAANGVMIGPATEDLPNHCGGGCLHLGPFSSVRSVPVYLWLLLYFWVPVKNHMSWRVWGRVILTPAAELETTRGTLVAEVEVIEID